MNMSETELKELLEKNKSVKVHKVSGKQFQKFQNYQKNTEKLSKYRNQNTESDGIKFDSKKEAARFQELLFLYRHGEITRLKLQETFVLQNGYKTEKGERIQAITYTTDFTYCKNNQLIAEDVKASAKFQDPVYKMKKKMFMERYPMYEFVETY